MWVNFLPFEENVNFRGTTLDVSNLITLSEKNPLLYSLDFATSNVVSADHSFLVYG